MVEKSWRRIFHCIHSNAEIMRLTKKKKKTTRGKAEMTAVIAVTNLAESSIFSLPVTIPINVIKINTQVKTAVIKGAKFALPNGTRENEE